MIVGLIHRASTKPTPGATALMNMTYLEQLAAAARPINDDDYGSDRQVEAENDFFDALDQHLADKLTEVEMDDFDAFCLKHSRRADRRRPASGRHCGFAVSK